MYFFICFFMEFIYLLFPGIEINFLNRTLLAWAAADGLIDIVNI